MKSRAQDNGVDVKQSIKKDEPAGKSKNKKGGDQVKKTQSQTGVLEGKLHSDVLVPLRFLFLACPVKIPF
jgi:nucleolar complex protein 3